MKSNKYLIVFDSNVLNIQYDKKADFTRFYFNSTFHNVIDKIEELDIYHNVSVAIPVVVWEEMKQQKIDAYHQKLEQVKRSFAKFSFPFYELMDRGGEEVPYGIYLTQEIEKYKNELSKRQVSILTLALPTEKKFMSIVDRAFKRKPPFGGKDTNSDKGFKDVLLWESILEYKSQNKDNEILFYTKDKIFNRELLHEFKELFNGSQIKFYQDNDEDTLLGDLEILAKALDKYSIQSPKYTEQPIVQWLFSDNFKKQFLLHLDVFNIINEFTSFHDMKILDIYDVTFRDSKFEGEKLFTIYMNAEVIFEINGSLPISNDYQLVVDGETFQNHMFSITDVYIEENEDIEDSV